MHPGHALPVALLAAAFAAPGPVGAEPFAPLEACTAAFPAGTDADRTPEGIGPVPWGRRDGHLWAHAKGYVHAPLSAVWGALRDPAVSRLREGDGRVVPEPAQAAPVQFRIDYRVRVLVFDVRWELAYRGGALAGSLDRLEDPDTAVGFRWDKASGTQHIRTLSASLVAREAAPGVTAVELVAWLDADRTGQKETVRTVTDWFDRIVARVHEARAARLGSAGP